MRIYVLMPIYSVSNLKPLDPVNLCLSIRKATTRILALTSKTLQALLQQYKYIDYCIFSIKMLGK